MAKVIDSLWWENIGLVKVDTEDGIQYFIGQCHGYNQEIDEQWIAKW